MALAGIEGARVKDGAGELGGGGKVREVRTEPRVVFEVTGTTGIYQLAQRAALPFPSYDCAVSTTR